jgi:LuxR family maltose regulon positive regulatory protein
LGRALSRAEVQGYVRTFVDEGPPMERLLSMAFERGIATDYVGTLLGAFVGATKDERRRTELQPPSSVPGPPALVESLSERELEVLRLIAEGLTNRNIAERLYLAPSTVKVHTRNMYGKLDVHSRTQAVAKARSLHLL